jgi:hypothetical protein
VEGAKRGVKKRIGVKVGTGSREEGEERKVTSSGNAI